MDRFATRALRLSGIAAAALGWRPPEFWDATPAELATILDALAPQREAPPASDQMMRLQEQFPDG